jgi:hypothetical protein
MSLDSLLEPVKWVDKQILREYSRLTQKAEGKGLNKYCLASSLNLGAKLFLIPASIISPINEYWVSNAIALGGSLENTFECLIYNSAAARAEDMETISHIKDPFVTKMKTIYSAMRLPVLASGVSQIGMGAVNIYNYFAEGDQIGLLNGVQQILLGTGLLSWSSAMYVRDSNPKLLDKKSVYSGVKKWLSAQVKSLSPSPVPIPMPVQSCSILDAYVK